MFIDKEALIEDYFVNPESINMPIFNGRRSALSRALFEKESFTMLLSSTGVEIKYYSADELYEKVGDELPDNIDGEVLVFFNTEDTARTLGL